MQINSEQSDQHPCTVPCEEETEYFKKPLSRKVRTLSVNARNSVESQAFEARIKHTFDYNSRGCKGNTRGEFIHDAYVTFEQLLRNLPLNIALNFEISKSHNLLCVTTTEKSENRRIPYALGSDSRLEHGPLLRRSQFLHRYHSPLSRGTHLNPSRPTVLLQPRNLHLASPASNPVGPSSSLPTPAIRHRPMSVLQTCKRL